MWNAVKSVAKSAPVWAWILMAICLAAIVVGVVIADNRTTHTTAALEAGVTAWILVAASGHAHS